MAAVQDWKIELWRIDQQMLNQEITNEEAHKLFEKWRLTHKDKMPGPSPKHVSICKSFILKCCSIKRWGRITNTSHVKDSRPLSLLF